MSSLMEAKAVMAAMIAKLRSSGLDGQRNHKPYWKILEFEPLTLTQLIEKYPNLTQYPAAGFVLPYFDRNGNRTQFYRFRYLEEPQRKGFDAVTVHKPTRYTQPLGLSPRVYFPRLIDWNELLSRPADERSLIITEGELKAACAASLGLPAVALGGVWNFRGGAEALIKDLAAIPWKDMLTFVVYDSDAKSNFQVCQAENALADELTALGARVRIVRLPEIEGIKKTGLDDFLLANGEPAMVKIAEETPEYTGSRELHRLNEEVVFVHDPGAVLELKTLQRMTPQNFSNSIYANRTWEQRIIQKNGTVRITIHEAAKEWVKWTARAEVNRTTYAPGLPRITEDKELNTWSGWGVCYRCGMPWTFEHDSRCLVHTNGSLEVRPKELHLWTELIDFLFASEKPEDKYWFQQWLAYPIQHPGTKMFSAVVAWGLIHGTGKTLVGHTMQRIYGKNFTEIADRDLVHNFNEWAEDKQFVMGDEITGGDKRISGDRMKSMITQRFLRINKKYIPEYVVPDCINYYFTSNHPDSFFLEDSDRRYFIHEVKGKPLPQSFYNEYDKWYKSPKIAALFRHLLVFPLAGFDASAPAPVTHFKTDMIEMGRSDIGDWVAELKMNPDGVLIVGDAKVNWSLVTRDELYAMYRPEERGGKLTRPGLARELRRGGFEMVNSGHTITTKTAGPQRLWAVRNMDELHKLNVTRLGEIYDRERNGTIPKEKGKAKF